jgi:hypothetical protein
MITNYKHPKDCPDQKAAASDRKQQEVVRMKRQDRLQIMAHAAWLEWYGVAPSK